MKGGRRINPIEAWVSKARPFPHDFLPLGPAVGVIGSALLLRAMGEHPALQAMIVFFLVSAVFWLVTNGAADLPGKNGFKRDNNWLAITFRIISVPIVWLRKLSLWGMWMSGVGGAIVAVGFVPINDHPYFSLAGFLWMLGLGVAMTPALRRDDDEGAS